jgi:hypothetical protein
MSFARGRFSHSFRLAIAAALSVCAASAAAQVTPKFKVLAFFSANYDAAHINFAHEANRWFPKAGAQYGFQYDSTKDWSRLTPQGLAGYQVVMFLDNQPSQAQRAGFQQWMDNGGAWYGFHVCAFNTNPSSWDWYYNQFLGCGAFKTNTWGPTSAVFKVEDTTHEATSRLPSKYTTTVSEWYGWNVDLRTKPDIKILCSIDPSSFPLGTDPNQSWRSGYYPIVWTNKKYKMIYSNFGHNDMDYNANVGKSQTFANETNNKLVIDALLWLGGQKAPTEVKGAVSRADRMAPLDARFGGGGLQGLSVTRGGLKDFGVSILDLRGNLLAEGRTTTGLYSAPDLRIGKGLYIIRSDSRSGSASSTLRVP